MIANIIEIGICLGLMVILGRTLWELISMGPDDELH